VKLFSLKLWIKDMKGKTLKAFHMWIYLLSKSSVLVEETFTCNIHYLWAMLHVVLDYAPPHTDACQSWVQNSTQESFKTIPLKPPMGLSDMVSIQVEVSCIVIPCSVVIGHLDGGSKVLQNTSVLLKHYMVSQTRRPWLISSPPWKPWNS